MKTALLFGRLTHLRTEMASYSNDVYEKLPFTLSDADAKLPDVELKNRIGSVIYKKYPPKHWGGCGYSCRVDEFVRETPTTGYVVLMHYHGIGD